MRIVAIEDVSGFKNPHAKAEEPPAELTVRLAHTRQGAKLPPRAPPGFPPAVKPDTYQRRLVLVPTGQARHDQRPKEASMDKRDSISCPQGVCYHCARRTGQTGQDNSLLHSLQVQL